MTEREILKIVFDAGEYGEEIMDAVASQIDRETYESQLDNPYYKKTLARRAHMKAEKAKRVDKKGGECNA